MFQTFVIGLVNFLCTFVAVFTVDRLGRRRLYIWGSSGMALSLVLITVGFLTGRTSGVLGLALILLFIASFAACIGPVYWILMAEMFPNRVRGLAMSIAVFATWFTNFFVVLLFPWLLKNIGGAATFGMIAVMALGMIFVAWKLVPETSGKTLEEIEAYWEAFAR
jgi:MFS family permease